MQKLNDLLQKPQEERHCKPDVAANSTQSESGNGDMTKCESGTKATLFTDKSEHGLGVLSDEDTSTRAGYFGMEDEPNLLNMLDADSSLTSPEDWVSLNSDGLFHQYNSDFQWWDFWS